MDDLSIVIPYIADAGERMKEFIVRKKRKGIYQFIIQLAKAIMELK